VKRLYLLRHAKSDWGEPGLADRDRPLAPRGRKAAPKVATYMVENDLKPDLALVSSALRARQTFEYFVNVFGGATVAIESSIYGAGVDELLELLRGTAPEHRSVLIVGHNPTIQDLALTLASDGPGYEAAHAKFPTSALAVLDADIERWSELGPGRARFTDFVTPKTLDL
jgi:phosphohistidine phosphatase